MMTATPRGSSIPTIVSAICVVKRSCTCNLRENISTIRANFDNPSTRPFGIYPICTLILYLVSLCANSDSPYFDQWVHRLEERLPS